MSEFCAIFSIGMKRFLLVFIFVLFTANVAFAGDNNSIIFNGTEYNLLFSEKSTEHNGYYNQYYKKGENEENWTEIIALHHFPNVYSPIAQAYNFKEYLGSYRCPCSMTIDESNNTGMIDFILIDGEKLPIIVEFNVFKYEKSKSCGTIAFQYAKKFEVYNTEEVETVKKSFDKFRPKAINKVKNFVLPDLVSTDIGKPSSEMK